MNQNTQKEISDAQARIPEHESQAAREAREAAREVLERTHPDPFDTVGNTCTPLEMASGLFQGNLVMPRVQGIYGVPTGGAIFYTGDAAEPIVRLVPTHLVEESEVILNKCDSEDQATLARAIALNSVNASLLFEGLAQDVDSEVLAAFADMVRLEERTGRA